MNPARKAALAAAISIATAVGACGGDDDQPASTAAEQSTTTAASTPAPPSPPAAQENGEGGTGEPAGPPPRDQPSGPAETAGGDPRGRAVEREAMRTVREFVAALDRRDGAAACALLAPGALDEIELPRPRGGCAAALEASIGYRDPRGLPVWKGAEVTSVAAPELGPDSAKVLVTVVTEFADRDELSVEDDVVYLTRDGGGWLVAKPSSTLYRAVGIADVPPTVLSPPAS